jgi:4-amino-4-deoxy-L-arabinose transferase-like glycosyltransferase
MYQRLSPKIWIVLLWGILVAVSLSVRPLIPVDETRYASVAWEMWVRNDFLVPYLNGEAYSHKPPLLFWLMQLSWWLFGVNEWSLRIISPLFALATFFLTRAVAKELWPERNQVAELTPFILLGSFIWIVFSTLTMFDIMLTFFVLSGIYSLLRLIRQGLSFKRWALFGIAIGGGVLTKGPVILLHVLPVALLAPWWLGEEQASFRWKQWYGGLLFAILIGALIPLCWAIPAGTAGGEAYWNAIFLGQTSGRLVDSFAHRLPWWWYLQILPLFLLPWLLLKPLWSGLAKLNFQDFGIRFCLAWVLPVFIAFSLVSGKRIHYLLPLMPALALLLAWAMNQVAETSWRRAHTLIMVVLGFLGLALLLMPWLNDHFHWREELSLASPLWGIVLFISAVSLGGLTANNAQESIFYVCTASIIAVLVITCGFFAIKGERYDTTPPALKIAELMNEKRAIVFYGNKYHGQFHFTGRLTQPIKVIANHKELSSFAARNPTGYILAGYEDSDELSKLVLSYRYPFKGQNLGFILCQTLIDNPKLGSILKPS